MKNRSLTHNRELMAQARTALKGNWGTAVGTCFIFIGIFIIGEILSEIFLSGLPNIVLLIIEGPLILGIAIFSLSLSRGHSAKASQLFDGFNHFGTALIALLLSFIIILIGYLLLIIPGIIASYCLMMTYFVIADDPSKGAWEAMKRSNELMRDKKWKFFCLTFRFMGWAILSIFTLGIGFLWLFPYSIVSAAKFYDDTLLDSKQPDHSNEETLAENVNPRSIMLTIEKGPNSGSFFPISKDTTIGRADDNDIVLNLKTVSGYHCKILYKDGQYLLKDLNSTNGTKVNGVVIKESVIEPGMTIDISKVILTVT